jgi:hypothetical protein
LLEQLHGHPERDLALKLRSPAIYHSKPAGDGAQPALLKQRTLTQACGGLKHDHLTRARREGIQGSVQLLNLGLAVKQQPSSARSTKVFSLPALITGGYVPSVNLAESSRQVSDWCHHPPSAMAIPA